MIGLLMEKNAKLAKENAALTEKNKNLVEVLDRRKAEITAFKRAAEAQAAKENTTPTPPPTDNKPVGVKVTNPAKTKVPTNSSEQSELSQLKEENARLRNLDGSNGTPSSSGFKGATRGKGDVESQLQDANRKLQTLQTAYDLMDIKIKSQALASKQSETQLESNNEKIRDLVKELKRDNRSLEEKIAGLSREPFIKGVFEQQEARMEVSSHSHLNPNPTILRFYLTQTLSHQCP